MKARRKKARTLWSGRDFLWLWLIAISSLLLIDHYHGLIPDNLFAYLSGSYNDHRNRNLRDFGITVPTSFGVHGLDVSRYQKNIDWSDVAKMNIDSISFKFAFIKATEGEEKVDNYFTRNWRESKKVGLYRGAYHFYRPDVPSSKQAKNFIKNVTLQSGDLPPVLDIEVTGRYSMDNTRKGLKNWLRLIKEHYQITPIIYTNAHFYRQHLQGHFDNYPVWLARYGENPPQVESKQWMFWQYSNEGKVNGIAGPVDFNVFRGDSTELRLIAKP